MKWPLKKIGKGQLDTVDKNQRQDEWLPNHSHHSIQKRPLKTSCKETMKTQNLNILLRNR